MKRLSVSMTKAETVWGWIFLPTQLLIIPIVLYAINMVYGSPLNDTQINFAYFCVNFICATVIFMHFLKENGKIALGNVRKCLLSAAKGFCLYFVLSYAVSILISALYPEFYNVNDEAINEMVQDNGTLMTIGTVLLVPVVEEVLYRGLVFQGIHRSSRVGAYIISMGAFAALHILSYVGMYEPMHLFMCFLQYLPAGFCLAWAYEQSDSIWAPILIHMSINQIAMLFMMGG